MRQSTQKTYSSGEKRYLSFCSQYNLSALPGTEDTLLLFITYLTGQGLTANSIRVYLAAVRAVHINEGYGNPLLDTYRVKKALRALDIGSKGPKQKLPLTLDILDKMYPPLPNSGYSLCMWTAMTLAFYGCLRASELTVAAGQFNPNIHLTNGDVIFNAGLVKPYVSVHIKRSKTDKFNKGFDVVIGCSGHRVCAYCSLLEYYKLKAITGPVRQDDPFLSVGGFALTKSLLQKETRLQVARLGLDPSSFSGHSFRSGSATTAAAAGLADWEIKLLGRWTSDAYQRYIRATPSLLSSFSSRMSKQQMNDFRLPFISNCI